MNPRQLKTFLAVARHGNFTRAASEINLAQSSLSDQMQALEEETGVQLFTRSRQGVTLTPAGDMLKAYAQEILALNDEAMAAVRTAAGSRGQTLSIGTLETVAVKKLAPFLSRFRKRNADIALTLKIGGSGELQRRLEDGSIDIAFTFDRGMEDERFVTRLISREPLVLISGHNAAEPPKDLAELSRLPFVATETGCVYRRLFDTAFTEADIAAPDIVTQADSITTIIRLVAAGAGYGLVPRLALGADMAHGDVRELPWPANTPTASLVMIWRRRRVQPPALSSLLAQATEDFRSVRPADARLRRAG
ncbi:DNA-binding transcriptional LysR family regulator [Rhizobium sp. BK650]|uniref:LysR family transcriptional regulator n=1 Tax=Rhizobium sp. BK650 TaxID=2586990 RepID=UPI0016158C7B|nr:LysR family transcriptional regulator [Rhizobium sp. BK650]MBB3656895.1 DNA-binding transcriptional LysR family regulator [Rhizobium sp. BK650]